MSGFSVRRVSRGAWIAGLAGLAAVAAALATGLAAMDRASPTVAAAAAPPPAVLPLAWPDVQPEPPPQLTARLEALAAAWGEPVGVAVADVDQGWITSVDGDTPYPQQSVSKLWVAVAALDAVDRGELSLEQEVVFEDADRSVFFQPIVKQLSAGGYRTTVRELMLRALAQSDNAANDKLIRTVGGVETVDETLRRLNLEGVGIGAEERDLQAQIAGLSWRPEYGYGRAFQQARAALPDWARDQAMDAYLAQPLDGASPAAIAKALVALKRGEVLSPGATGVLLAMMAEANTGPNRLKGGLPLGWSIAHKTGTGQDLRGYSIGINDVGLLTAPDGRTYAVAVMMRRTHKPVPQRLAFMQAVSRAVAESWAAEAGPAAELASLRKPGELSE
ncbi:serine hydrolase [Phenylobacterium terrae]|uniref:Serine hydrolase n=1 Tax=Phenylobacterium terrae TaxID=2665495 RepID=A0ABW4N0B5_9CAUL